MFQRPNVTDYQAPSSGVIVEQALAIFEEHSREVIDWDALEADPVKVKVLQDALAKAKKSVRYMCADWIIATSTLVKIEESGCHEIGDVLNVAGQATVESVDMFNGKITSLSSSKDVHVTSVERIPLKQYVPEPEADHGQDS